MREGRPRHTKQIQEECMLSQADPGAILSDIFLLQIIKRQHSDNGTRLWKEHHVPRKGKKRSRLLKPLSE